MCLSLTRTALRRGVEILHLNGASELRSLEQWQAFRTSLSGALLPHILLGLTATTSLYHSENSSLHGIQCDGDGDRMDGDGKAGTSYFYHLNHRYFEIFTRAS